MTPESARGWEAEARKIIRAALGSSPSVLAVLEAKADSWVHRLVPELATALQAEYAAGHAAGIVEERVRWEAARRAAPPTPNP